MVATLLANNIYRQVYSTGADDLDQGGLPFALDTTIPITGAIDLTRVGAYVTIDTITSFPDVSGSLSNNNGVIRITLINGGAPGSKATATVEIVLYHTRVQANDSAAGATGYVQVLNAFGV